MAIWRQWATAFPQVASSVTTSSQRQFMSVFQRRHTIVGSKSLPVPCTSTEVLRIKPCPSKVDGDFPPRGDATDDAGRYRWSHSNHLGGQGCLKR